MRRLWRWLAERFRHPRPVIVPPPVVVPPPVIVPSRVPLLADFTTVLAYTDFSNGPSPWTAWGLGTTMDIVDDPTGGTGKVCRITYSTKGGILDSSDQNIEFNTSHKFRYNEPVLFRGKFYIPKTVNANNTRKLVDWFNGGAPNARLCLLRENGSLKYFVCQYEPDGLWHADVQYGNTNIPLLDDQWYELAVMMLPNSADGVYDAVLEIWADGLRFRLDKGLSPITERDGAISCFSSFRAGTQLTSQPSDSAVTEYRYWKEIGLYTTKGVAA